MPSDQTHRKDLKQQILAEINVEPNQQISLHWNFGRNRMTEAKNSLADVKTEFETNNNQHSHNCVRWNDDTLNEFKSFFLIGTLSIQAILQGLWTVPVSHIDPFQYCIGWSNHKMALVVAWSIHLPLNIIQNYSKIFCWSKGVLLSTFVENFNLKISIWNWSLNILNECLHHNSISCAGK